MEATPRWWGPAVIIRRVGDASYVIQWGDNDTQLSHIDDLKEYQEPEMEGEGVGIEFKAVGIVDGYVPQEKNAEKILMHRMWTDGKFYYFVKWENLGYELSSWEEGIAFTRKFTKL